jgi:eukaryotic-like serine/threonine-protein kinase
MRDDFASTEQFDVVRYLGEGAAGVVYEAIDRRRDTRVALKRLKATDPHLLLRFKNEFRALQDLQHPNLVTLGELVSSAGQWFFTMELVDGIDLHRYVRPTPSVNLATDGGFVLTRADAMAAVERASATDSSPERSFDLARLRSTLTQLVDALCALHEANKVHRDIKPSNILVTGEGRVVVLDFGLVVDAASTAPSEASLVGSADYMAPEQGASQPVGPAADWYSVGVVMYELMTGSVPFDGSPLEVLTAKQRANPRPPQALVPGIPDDLNQLCMDLLRRDPRERPTGAAIARILRGSPGPTAELDASPPHSARDELFVGRAGQFLQLRAIFERVLDGERAVVLVHGESGIGKTVLVRRFTTRVLAEVPMCIVLHGRCYEREMLPYKALDGVIDQLSSYLCQLPAGEVAAFMPGDAGLLRTVFPVLGRVPAISGASAPGRLLGRELVTRAYFALSELLLNMARQRPLLVFIDDFQWADSDSLVLLNEVMQVPGPLALGLVATVRTDPRQQSGPEGNPLHEISLPAHTHHIALDGLSESAARELAEKLIDRAGIGRPALAAAVAAEAKGHPLFIQEIVGHLRSAGALAAGPVKLDDALWQRVEQLPPPARALVTVLAVAGGPMHQEVAAAAADMGFSAYQRWAQVLRVANLIRYRGAGGAEWVEVYHNRLRQAVVDHLNPPELQDRHRRIARALDRQQPRPDPEVLVYHLEAARESAAAAAHAASAANRARDQLAFGRAAELYQTALRLGSHSDSQTRALRIELAQALVGSGRGAQAAAEFLAAANGADPATALACKRRAALHLLVTGNVASGLTALREVIEAIGARLPRTRWRGRLAFALGRVRVHLRGMRWRDCGDLPAAARDRLDSLQASAMALTAIDPLNAAVFANRFYAEALASGSPAHVASALFLEAGFQALRGDRGLRRARKLWLAGQRAAQELDEPLLTGTGEGTGGVIEYCAGNLSEARNAFEVASLILRDHATDSAWQLQLVRTFHLWTLRLLGQSRELRRRLIAYRRDAVLSDNRYAQALLVRNGMAAWLERDKYDEAVRELEATAWDCGPDSRHLMRWYDLKARCELELYQRAGQFDFAACRRATVAATDHVSGHLQIIRIDTDSLLAAMALLDAERGERSEARLRTAQRLARRLIKQPVGYARARGLLVLAAVAARRGGTEAARHHLRQAIALAQSAAMAAHVAAAEIQLGRLTDGGQGAEFIDRGERALRAEGILNLDRYLGLVSPGFP